MPYIMRGRNESAVYFEYDCSLRKADELIRSWNQVNPTTRIDVFHIAVYALAEAMQHDPNINRFVAGGRLYQHRDTCFSYAIKETLEVGAPLVAVKHRFDVHKSFSEAVLGMQRSEAAYRSGRASRVERELGLLLLAPGFVRRGLMHLVGLADRLGVLPRSYVENDPMYTSAFIANMASMGMPAVYHHLYEYGTASIFLSVGRPVNAPGSPPSGPDRHRSVTLRWTFDERTEDGLRAWMALRRIRQTIEDPVSRGLVVEPIVAEADPPPEDSGRARRLWRPSIRQ